MDEDASGLPTRIQPSKNKLALNPALFPRFENPSDRAGDFAFGLYGDFGSVGEVFVRNALLVPREQERDIVFVDGNAAAAEVRKHHWYAILRQSEVTPDVRIFVVLTLEYANSHVDKLDFGHIRDN